MQWAAGIALAISLFTPASGALPPAGSVIGNQASATYTDSGGQVKTATSNLVETRVQQVGSYTMVQDNSKTAAVGNTVYMPHVLTNTGNGNDTFKLSLTDNTGTFTAGDLAIYLDANQNGLPDSTTPLCSGVVACTNYTTTSLPAGGTFKFVVSMSIPGGATAAQTDSVTVTATPGTPALYTTTSITNTDTVTVTAGAAFQVTKSISLSQGPTGVQLTYSLNYKNVGSAAGTLVMYDQVGTGATVGYDYVAGSATWSAGSSTLNDNVYVVATPVPDATVGGMDAHYQAVTSSGVTTIQAGITNVGANVSGIVTFKVLVKATAAAGTSTTTNTAYYGVDTDTDPTNNPPGTLLPTNPSPYTVLSNRGVVANDNIGSSADGTNTRPLNTDTDSGSNVDLKYVATAVPGVSATFDNYIWNTGNQADTVNVAAAMLAGGGGYGTWPANTTVQLFKSDGSTPLLDTNGDGAPDTGSLAAGSSYKVVVKITVPAGACASGCPTGPFDVELTGTSVGDSSVSNKTYDRIGALAGAPQVDLANVYNATVDTANNQQPVDTTPTFTTTTLPGRPAVIPLYSRNEGGVPDTYNLAYSSTNAFGPTTALPAGWTVEFRSRIGTGASSTCSATEGNTITSVGPVPVGSVWLACAIVTPPSDAAAATTGIYFQVLSQVTGASDVVYDAVTVQAVNGLSLSPNNTGQVAPGGTVVYAHTLSNTGNTSCAQPYNFTVTDSLSSQGWTYAVYVDANGNGEIDSGETPLFASPTLTYGLTTPAAMSSGTQLKLLVKVFAPAGATNGTVGAVTMQVQGTCGGSPVTTATVTDTTTVIAGQVRLIKTQALDAACGNNPGALTFSTATLTAKPGECLFYRVVATNESTTTVTALSISDTLPSYTTLTGVGFVQNPTCSVGTPSYTAPTFTCSAITLTSGGSATLTMSVKLMQ